MGAGGTPLGYNLFAYCQNNPVNKFDPTGEVAVFGILGGMAIGAAASIISDAVAASILGEKFTIVDAFASGLGGAATGGFVAAGVPAGVASVIGTAIETAYKGVLNQDDPQTIVKNTLKETGKTAASALLLHGTGKVVQSFVKGKYVKGGLLTKLVQKMVYEPKYLNEQSVKTIAVDSFWDSSKKVGNALVMRLLT